MLAQLLGQFDGRRRAVRRLGRDPVALRRHGRRVLRFSRRLVRMGNCQ